MEMNSTILVCQDYKNNKYRKIFAFLIDGRSLAGWELSISGGGCTDEKRNKL